MARSQKRLSCLMRNTTYKQIMNNLLRMKCVRAKQNHFLNPSHLLTAKKRVFLECLTKWWTLTNNQSKVPQISKTCRKNPSSKQIRLSCKPNPCPRNHLKNKGKLLREICQGWVPPFLIRNGLPIAINSRWQFQRANKNNTKVKSSLRAYSHTTIRACKSPNHLHSRRPLYRTKFFIKTTPSRIYQCTTFAKFKCYQTTTVSSSSTNKTKAHIKYITFRSSKPQATRYITFRSSSPQATRYTIFKSSKTQVNRYVTSRSSSPQATRYITFRSISPQASKWVRITFRISSVRGQQTNKWTRCIGSEI